MCPFADCDSQLRPDPGLSSSSMCIFFTFSFQLVIGQSDAPNPTPWCPVIIDLLQTWDKSWTQKEKHILSSLHDNRTHPSFQLIFALNDQMKWWTQYKFTHMQSSRPLIAGLKNTGSYKSALLNPPGTIAEITAPRYWSHPTDGGYHILCRCLCWHLKCVM